MKRLLGMALAACVAAAPISAGAQQKIRVKVVASTDDTVGKQFTFHVRDQLNRSGTFSTDPNGGLIVQLVTLDPDNQSTRTIYSYTFLISGGDDNLDSYLTSGVGLCGKSLVQSCAGDLMTQLGEQVETIRQALSETRKDFN